MKKVLILLLILPIVINAEECDYSKHQEYLNYANNITYENDFSISDEKFTITINNLISDVYVEYNEKKYSTFKDNTLTLSNILEGSLNEIYVYTKTGCNTPIKSIIINEPYYNQYYKNSICDGYEDKLTLCSSKFSSYPVTKDLVETAIYNYENNIIQDSDEVEEPVKATFFDKVMDFALDWGIKIVLAIMSTIFSTMYFNSKLRKVKHGIQKSGGL